MLSSEPNNEPSSSALSRRTATAESVRWWPVTTPPEPYEIVYLLFPGGKIRRGTWNGKIWWGYDERVQRSCALEPTAWRAFSDARSRVIAGLNRLG
jgi:hypothetical protein